MHVDPLSQLAPAKEPLLDLVFQRVDASMLREIAEADYGEDADDHLRELVAIKRGDVPDLKKWEPKEVLELVRWSEPEDPGATRGSIGERKHWMRLFSCAVLLRAGSEPDNELYLDGQESTIIQFVDSAMKLSATKSGPGTALIAMRFLCWRMQCLTSQDEVRPYFAIAILLLLVWLGKRDPQLAEYLIAAANPDETTIGRLFRGCLKGQKWKNIARQMLVDSIQPNNDLRRFGGLLIGRTDDE